jgi:Lar family restriction alleviation protein
MTGPVALLPCPFCGGTAEFIGDRRKSTIVACTECGASLETVEEWGQGRAWNTRQHQPRFGALSDSAD